MVGRLSAFLEDIGHAEGVAHLDEPITHCCSEAVIDAVERAFLPRRDVLLFRSAFHFFHLVSADAETDLRSDAQSWDLGFVLVVLVPLAEVDVEQQRHGDVMRLLQVTDAVIALVQAFLHTRSLPRIHDVDLGAED